MTRRARLFLAGAGGRRARVDMGLVLQAPFGPALSARDDGRFPTEAELAETDFQVQRRPRAGGGTSRFPEHDAIAGDGGRPADIEKYQLHQAANQIDF